MKKGVKRKADTTTPAMAGTPDPPFAPTEPKVSKISKRRESGRQIKKVVKDLPDSQARVATAGKNREKMQESMKACNEILKELFSKKHSVSERRLRRYFDSSALLFLFFAVYNLYSALGFYYFFLYVTLQ